MRNGADEENRCRQVETWYTSERHTWMNVSMGCVYMVCICVFQCPLFAKSITILCRVSKYLMACEGVFLDMLCLHIYLLLSKQLCWWLAVDSIKLWLWGSMGFCKWAPCTFITHFTGPIIHSLAPNLKTQCTAHNANAHTEQRPLMDLCYILYATS